MQNSTANSTTAISTPIILSIILIEGFITIALEILTIRQLIPIAGNSVIVTSLIIGVFLLFLAYGYRRGGHWHTDLASRLKLNFCIAAVILGIGLSYPFVYILVNLLHNLIGLNLLIALTAYLLLITAPLIYLLGQTVPITMNMLPSKERAGKIGGKVLHLSTVGSFLGAVLTSLLLLNFLGSALTVCVLYALLVGLIFLLANNSAADWRKFLILGCAAVFTWYFNLHYEQRKFVYTNAYANYAIDNNFNYKQRTGKLFVINDSASSFIDQQKNGFSYIELIKQYLFDDLQLKNKNILIIGAGGFTLSAKQTFNNNFIYVDIDPDIKKVVQENFIKTINGKFVAEDARTYLNRPEVLGKFHAVVADAYNSTLSIPPHLLTYQYFTSIKNALAVDGIAIFNIIAKPDLSDSYSKRIDNTIRAVFNNCRATPLQYSKHVNNIIYICNNQGETDNTVYTDDKNPATLDYFESKS